MICEYVTTIPCIQIVITHPTMMNSCSIFISNISATSPLVKLTFIAKLKDLFSVCYWFLNLSLNLVCEYLLPPRQLLTHKSRSTPPMSLMTYHAFIQLREVLINGRLPDHARWTLIGMDNLIMYAPTATSRRRRLRSE